MNTRKIIALTIVAAGSTVASLPAAADAEHRAKALEIIKRDFQPRGQAGVDRLAEDGLQAICNRTGNNPPEYIAKRMEADQLATVKLPADGKLLGDWKEGEKIAQSGRGFTWTDNPGLPVGGNCYNCHQISPKELSFGTIGPSLFQLWQAARQHAGHPEIHLQQDLERQGLQPVLGDAALWPCRRAQRATGQASGRPAARSRIAG